MIYDPNYVHKENTANTWNSPFWMQSMLASVLQFLLLSNKITAMDSQSTTNKMQNFSNALISVRCCTCFRRVFRPSSGAQNCTYSVRHLSDRYCYLLLAWMWWDIPTRLAPGSSNGLTNAFAVFCSWWWTGKRLKHAERLTEINKLENRCIFWLYSENILGMHGPMNVKSTAMEFILKRRDSSAFFLYLMTQDSI